MATPQPPSQAPLTPSERLALEQKARYDRITRNFAIGGVILCPVIALLPPRKLDLYTFSLAVGFYLSADHLAQSHNGRPLVQQFRFGSGDKTSGLPTEKAEILSKIAKEKREEERIRREGIQALANGNADKGKVEEENKNVLHRLWMGDEKEGWKERRMEEERKALEEGKTYTDMIFEQIWEVWNWDKKSGSEGEGKGDGKKE
ncbi:hypothetical protein DM02DRAFT_613915 [Periconia macrospinosa]|uniref:Uncharacterized protein n=1 Tax=Periconia macrospinosa TaxID=97972 RepID=A0A2V1DW51_9PLEO|nr:hypothetical protein DM02DRAFT_613915 [Periconia macrospinosa]